MIEQKPYEVKPFNVMALRVSTSKQDVERQRDILNNLGKQINISFDYSFEDEGVKRWKIARKSFEKLDAIAKEHPEGFNLWYSDITRCGTEEFWEANKQWFKDRAISVFTPHTLFDIVWPETFENKIVVRLLFMFATQELASLEQRIKGKQANIVKNGGYLSSIRYITDLECYLPKSNKLLFTIHQLISTNRVKRNKKNGVDEKKYKITYTEYGKEIYKKTELVEFVDKQPPSKDNERNKILDKRPILTSDGQRLENVKWVFDWCLEQKKKGIGYNWRLAAKELHDSCGGVDTYGCGWAGDRIKNYITNPICIGIVSSGGGPGRKSSPPMYWRDSSKPDGFALNKNIGDKAHKPPASHEICSDHSIFDFLLKDEWVELVKDIKNCEKDKTENIEKINEVRKELGLKKLTRHTEKKLGHGWLNEFVWDDVHKQKYISSGEQFHCSVAQGNYRRIIDDSKKVKSCQSFARKHLELIIKDYFRLPAWNLGKKNDADIDKTLASLMASMDRMDSGHGGIGPQMWELIQKHIPNDERLNLIATCGKGDYLPTLYGKALETANLGLVDDIRTIDAKISKLIAFIEGDEEENDAGEIKDRLRELRKQKATLEKKKIENLLPAHEKEKKNMFSLVDSLKRLRAGEATDAELQSIMIQFGIKIHINCNDLEKYVSVSSSKLDVKLEISEKDYTRYYRNRFMAWAKGHEFDYLEKKCYSCSEETAKKRNMPSYQRPHKKKVSAG